MYDLKNQTSRLIPLPAWLPQLTFHRSLMHPNGHILIVGGIGGQEKVIEFNPETEEFSQRGILRVPREDHAILFLDDHRVLITGGSDAHAKTVASMEIFDLTTNHSELLPFELHEAREDHNLIPLKDGLFMVTGGEAQGNPDIILKSAEILNLNTGEVVFLKDLFPEGRSDFVVTLVKSDMCLSYTIFFARAQS